MTAKRACAGMLAALLAALGLPAVVQAHDTWLVPSSFRPQPGARVKLSVATSEAFPTSDGAAAPDRIARFTVRTAAGDQQVTGYAVDGMFLVGQAAVPASGHVVAVAETKARLIVLEAAQFNEYIGHEELKDVIAARAAAGQADTQGREMYRKIAKAALCVGAQQEDAVYARPFGLWLEILPERSPCGLRVGDALTVRVLFQGQPIAGVHVAAGYEGVTGHSYPVWIPTDRHGRATVQLDRAGAWFVRSLHMIPLEDNPEAQWESAFSTLTFEVQPANGDGEAAAIRRVLDGQAAAWNRGDIEAFVEGYWKSDRLTFSGSSGVTRGWKGLLERYRRSYPTRAAMGTLSFSDLEITQLAPDAALVLGRWRLDREKDAPGGSFSLVMRKFPEGWRVVHDHTSSDE
jgi:uncharacterized GH25 family protein/ketosteroid isomerase-like protein